MIEPTNKAKRAEITIAGIKVEVFQLPDGEYVMSQAQVAKVVSRHPSSVLRFLDSKDAKSLPGLGFTDCSVQYADDIEGRGQSGRFNAVPLSIASAYWMYQAFGSNSTAKALAHACMIESLERRCDAVFKQVKTEDEYEAQSAINFERWRSSRSFSKRCQSAFNAACFKYGFDPADAHDRLTRAITGKTAQEHRCLPLKGDKPWIGLDHVPLPSQLQRIAQAKLNFSSYKSGTLAERIRRAVAELD